MEDQPDLRVLAESNIADAGYTTLSAANAREALALLDEHENFSLMFTDINMPDGPDGIDGFELARRAVETHSGLRVIYTTGGALTDGMMALFVEGATLLRKPYTRINWSRRCRARKPDRLLMIRHLVRAVHSPAKQNQSSPALVNFNFVFGDLVPVNSKK